MADSNKLSLDPLFMARSLFRRRRFEECVKICSDILQSNPYDQVTSSNQSSNHDDIIPNADIFVAQAAWYLKGRGLTEQTYVDEVEMEEEGIAELFMDDTAIADVASKHTPLLYA